MNSDRFTSVSPGPGKDISAQVIHALKRCAYLLKTHIITGEGESGRRWS